MLRSPGTSCREPGLLLGPMFCALLGLCHPMPSVPCLVWVLHALLWAALLPPQPLPWPGPLQPVFEKSLGMARWWSCGSESCQCCDRLHTCASPNPHLCQPQSGSGQTVSAYAVVSASLQSRTLSPRGRQGRDWPWPEELWAPGETYARGY